MNDLSNPISLLTYEEFKILCIIKGVKRSKIKYAYDILISEQSVVKLAKKYKLAINTIYQDRWRYKKKLLA